MLVIDNFSICMTSKQDLDYLHQAINAKYATTIDTTCSLYLGMAIMWNYFNQHVDVSMPGYIAGALDHFDTTAPPRPQHSPHI